MFNQIVLKANRVLGTIKRPFASRDAHTVRLLYTTLVHPILDYALPDHLEPLFNERHSYTRSSSKKNRKTYTFIAQYDLLTKTPTTFFYPVYFTAKPDYDL